MLTLTLIQKIAVWAIPVLLAITLHEAAHAFVAYLCGDSTAKMLGRLSMNPLRHIDLMGTIIVPIFVAIVSGFQFVFGWAKPVPINGSLLHKPRRDTAFVAAAGPLSNLIMAILWALMFKITTLLQGDASKISVFLLLAAQAGIVINLILAFLNLIPIPPLDGSRIIASLLPPKQAWYYLKLEPYGFFILLALLFTGFLSWFLNPALLWSYNFLQTVFNL